MTAHDLRKLLRLRHSKTNGNGPEWAYVEEVRNEAGFDATRTLDALALHLWTSRGNEMHGYEIKVSRSDLLRELKEPEKADVFYRRCDRFWLVCAPNIILPGEVPVTWGLMVPNSKGDALRVARPAPLNTSAQRDTSRSFLACLLRSAGVAMKATPDQQAIQAARDEGYAQGVEQSNRSRKNWEKMYHDQAAHIAEWRQWEMDFQKLFGMSLHRYGREPEQRRQDIFAGLKAVMGESESVQRARNNVENAARELDRQATILKQQAEYIRKGVGVFAGS